METPCKLAHWYLVPAITAELSRELGKLGMRQNDIARALGLTPAAVSHYMSRKRGCEMKLSKDVRRRISMLAKDMKEKSLTHKGIVVEVCAICSLARDDGISCTVHGGKAAKREAARKN